MRVWYRMRDVVHVPDFGTDDISGADNNPHAVPVVLANQCTNSGTKPSPNHAPNSCTENGNSKGCAHRETHHIRADAVSVVLANKYTNGGTKSSPDRDHHSQADEISHLSP